MTPLQFAEKYIGGKDKDWYIKNEEIVAEHCPFCDGGERKDKYTFALNLNSKAYNCKREANCGESGSYFKLLKYFGEDIENKFQVKLGELKSKTLIDYLKSRGITLDTARVAGVKQKSNNTLAFEMIHNYEIVGIKYRQVKLNEKDMCYKEKDGLDVFIGNINTSEDLIIVEGEMDYLSVKEAGFSNVISLPSGAGSGKKLDCVTRAYRHLEKVKDIILFLDNDEPGRQTKEELINRLDATKCWEIKTKYKDANEILMNEGKQGLIDAIQSKTRVKLKDVDFLVNAKSLDLKKLPSIKTRLIELDQITGGLILGLTSVWTGKNGSGKSTLLNQIIANSVDQEYKICIYSGELSNSLLRYWIELSMAGRNNIEFKPAEKGEIASIKVKPEKVNALRSWYGNNLIVCDSTKNREPKNLLEKFKQVYKVYGTKLFVVDNLMTLDFGGYSNDIFEKERKFMQDCADFAEKYEVHVAVITHPIKTKEKITKDCIRGSGHITNIAHQVYMVHRMNDKELLEDNTYIEVAKNRLLGIEKEVKVVYEPISRRFYGKGDDVDRKLGWDK
jgi:twinkle protein